MKSRLYIIAICFLLMAVLPLISKKDVMDLIRPAAEEINISDTEESEDKDDKDVFRILDSSTGKITVVPDSNFCIGALAYEMPPLYEDEALKAQTVALYSHFCYIRERNRKACDPELKGADLAADLSNGEIWYSEKQLKEKWGSGFYKYIKKLSGIVSSVQGEVIRDKNGAYADCCYFAQSCGKTEGSKDIFGYEKEYLQAVSSPWDRLAPDNRTRVEYTDKEFRAKLEELSKNSDCKMPSEKLIGKTERTPSGSVITIEIGGVQLSGQSIRTAYGLRSAVFDLFYKGGSFIFMVSGYGHGVGMSQYGANSMAKEGFDYHEILSHYYSISFHSE